MAGHQAAGDAGGSPQHTPNQDNSEPGWTRAEQLAALEELRAKFPDTAISQLPRITCGNCRNAPGKVCNTHERTWCQTCSQNVSNQHMHLSYVGHAEATARLLNVDPLWNWEPVALTEQGLPMLDQFGGMWIRLTVAGMTRLGYGDAEGKKPGPHAIKEIIGDAIRNAGMRFGMALDLWSKTDIHAVPEPELSPGQKLAARIREQRIWRSVRGLRVVREEAATADLLDFVVEDADWYTIGELIDRQIAVLEEQATRDEDRRAAAPAARAAAATQVAVEHGVPVAEQRAFVDQAFIDRVANGWNSVDATQMALSEATARGLVNHWMAGPGEKSYQVGLLLTGRLAELRTYNQEEAA
ncbi:hypothetical protein KCMC57_64380 (plasmid) [Kitasatospora sp. CMC57]|uniref:Uncharacterized protein n=1 Tax=Kitasatospora sp. CMC57 TaxID=3231513 RepID=A0AB33KBA2_9ACTN